MTNSTLQSILASALGAGFLAAILGLWKIMFPKAEDLIEKHKDKDKDENNGL